MEAKGLLQPSLGSPIPSLHLYSICYKLVARSTPHPRGEDYGGAYRITKRLPGSGVGITEDIFKAASHRSPNCQGLAE